MRGRYEQNDEGDRLAVSILGNCRKEILRKWIEDGKPRPWLELDVITFIDNATDHLRQHWERYQRWKGPRILWGKDDCCTQHILPEREEENR